MTLPIVLTIAGCAALLVGLFGGGVKAKEIEVPKISLLPRVISSLTGLALIGVAIWVSPNPQADAPAAETPTVQAVLIGVSATQVPPIEVSPTKIPPTAVPPTDAPSPTNDVRPAMTATAFVIQATQMEATSQAIATRQKEIELTQTAAARFQFLAGQWYWNGSPGPVIYVDGTSLRIDMSAYGRTSATGRILNESTIEVTFDDNTTFIGKLVGPNRIEWSNGTVWEKF